MSSEQFRQDLRKGQTAEAYVRNLLRAWGYTVHDPPDVYFPDFDLAYDTPTGTHTLEIKYDIKSSETGRIYLELEALSHTKADLLAIVTDNPRTVYFCHPKPVLEFALQWPWKVRGGEFSQLAALVPRSIFLDRIKPQIISEKPA